MKRPSRRVAELWLEIKPVLDCLTEEDVQWFTVFIGAYHLGNFSALETLCGGKTELYFEMKSEITYMRDINKRCIPNPKRKRKLYGGDYSHVDYVIDNSANPEDALIEAIDSNIFLQEFN